jgi:NAD(P)-dependent dehydrogenase (short-subunit alcohol dehydrogenase family)
MNPLHDRIALITGASRGIGRATALAMARAGADVVAVARSEGQLGDLARQIEAQTGRRALPCAADVSCLADVQRAVRAALDAFERIDVLVNNAGVRTAQAPLWETTPQEWDTMMAVNLRGAFLCCREVLPGMIERRSGHIINVISTVSQIGMEQMSGYSASKWGLLGMTKSLVKEARPYGVRVSAISPGGTDSTFRSTPRPDYLAPETVAEAIVYVASLPETAVVHDLIVRPMVETNF